MSQEFRDLIGDAVRDEPKLGIDRRQVIAAGRRKLRLRQAGLAGGSVLGVVTVAAVLGAVLSPVDVAEPGPAGTEAGTGPVTSSRPATTSASPPAPGVACPDPLDIENGPLAETGPPTAEPRYPNGPPGNDPSSESLAEAGRLTAAVRDFAFPAPAGVPVPPIELCAAGETWQARVPLAVPAGGRTVMIEVRPRAGAQTDDCGPALGDMTAQDCRVETRADGTVLKISSLQVEPTHPTMASVTAWRPDATFVNVLETGSIGDPPAPRLLDDNALIAIATAAALKVNWLSNRPAEASNPRARELSDVIAAGNVLPGGMQAIKVPTATVEPLTFYVSQGVYKLNADLIDAAGEGNLFVSIGPPAAGHDTASCDGLAGCELITMPNGRKAAVLRATEFEGTVTLLTVSTITADGTQIDVTSRNLSERASGSGKNPPRPQPTRPEPPLAVDDLARIASLSGLAW